MLDIGLGEIVVLAIVALLVFGPDRLPKAAADAARALRHLRQVASSARQDLVQAAGLEEDDGVKTVVGQLRDLDPRRSLDPRRPTPQADGNPGRSRRPAGSATSGSLPDPTRGGQAAAPPRPAEAQADPDWS